ncbi:sensor histidine kinase [Amylibacter sp. IMCC11727]|uniref:sensor histidine kinase n=1 Tax=Amylibacter sp. IMCC11727 TaxID=3039851 RepID=UPI00244DDAD9|nr:sensor histidine kinase [Amylibacter sp. IMCC11727]WGI21443.1 sensor histidine kinase [Amylibacter sp. IMCC11727]
MAILADEHMTEEPRGGRGNLFSNVANAIGLSGGRGLLRSVGLENLTRIRTSALARRIITFNLIALCILLVGMLYLNQFKGGLVVEKQSSMVIESELYTNVIEARLFDENTTNRGLIEGLPVSEGLIARVYLPDESIAVQLNGASVDLATGSGFIAWLGGVLDVLPGLRTVSGQTAPMSEQFFASEMAKAAFSGQESIRRSNTQAGETVLAVSRPIMVDGSIAAAMVLTSQPGYLDGLLAAEQQSVLRLFLLAVVVSIVLSVALANTIANPIHDLARAAEAGTTKEGRQDDATRVRIPDLSGRPDEIGRLSRAMRDMTSALYDRIDTNEEFAADVAHEIKNPLASLRSAVETLRIAPEGDGRVRLLDVIEHDVRRLDRLVSDISNASRLDAELVKEEEEVFDLTLMLSRIAEFHTHEANDKEVELIWDEPDTPIMFDGMEARLAQVFVNLISNAISFCGQGDAVRVWAREKDNRVLIVVEDTGPGIPEEALTKVFKRFYSERPEHDYGNNSGLGLSISKQIVEAHKGVIWAENIHARDAEDGDAPLGARFVVGLPV